MEGIPPWPESIFIEESILEMDKTGLPTQAKNKQFKSIVKTWLEKREAILHDIENATEIMQERLESATEFLGCKTLTETRVNALRTQCEDHSVKMDNKSEELLIYKSEHFIKAYPLGAGAKEYIKEEFKRISTHMRGHQKCVNSELAKILADKEKEEKPAPTAAPAVQPSGSGTSIQNRT